MNSAPGQVAVTDFQSYRTTQTLRVNPFITIIAGRNNVGKTALLRSLRLPVEDRQGVGPSCTLKYEWECTHEELVAVLPGFEAALREVGITQPRPQYRLTATLAKTASFGRPGSTAGAGAFFGSLLLIDARIADTNLHVTLEQLDGNPSTARLWWKEPVPPTLESRGDLITAWSNLMLGYLSSTYYIHPRRYGTQPAPLGATDQLAPDGSNLTPLIGTLASNQRRTTFAALQRFMRSAFPDIFDIDAKVTGTPAVATLHVIYSSPPDELSVPLEHCGTGIEQLLMLATAILTADKPRLFLIDEPHAFLHPAAERSLLRLIDDHPEHQYIIATHSGVFLNAVPLDHARLVTIDGTGSHINDVRHATDILTAVGVTAADLWSADALFWVEGPSEVKAVEEIIAGMPEVRDVSIRVLAMPDWIRSLAASEKKAAATVEFCESVRQAVTPFKVPALFLFDADEKQADQKDRIEAATGDRARFLPVRELENLFLAPEAVQRVLADLCSKVGMQMPTVAVVTAEMNRLLDDTGNHDLYKITPAQADAARVVGSAVLDRLWWTWAATQYDKVAYGPQLANAVAVSDPEKLEPLMHVLRELADSVREARTAR